ncbi:TIGR03364 family FAD-dependent oxidoreductase [Aeromicrobium sp. Leaf350]|uniref:TIGR03364 family FAD-dependent oxidoreductase n=1 Tax=Aeromicrobium sp. Leaf350 TaxID=2876565 RepID=UPI001E5804A7|nr:TIGR03364 family FAD-dependent oxidoreductase [Aeromicrobium sp. Leaf350]
MSRQHVVVVGAGIVGLGAALAAVKRGCTVTVVDRAGEPSGSTVRNFGHLCIGAQTGRARAYADVARGIWIDLARETGLWLRASGTLVAARHDDEMALLAVAARDGGIALLEATAIEARASLRAGSTVGGAHIAPDLQVDPRTASAAIRSHLASLGVEFRLRTAVGRVAPGLVSTTRGDLHADVVVVAVNHDLDQLLPDLAESVGVQRCGLDMMRVHAPGVTLPAPLLTGWSLTRYGRFAGFDEAVAVRDRLHAERPDLAAIDLNQMYTQLPDGSLIVGDSHVKGIDVSPFQPEATSQLFLDELADLFGTTPVVTERWQGVYASGPDEFLVDESDPGVLVLAATTGIGMTTGLGLAELHLGAHLDQTTIPLLEGTTR